MKRTKQAYYRQNPTQQETFQSSGLNFLIGQDVTHYCRVRDYQKLQKQYLDQHVQQKKQINATKKLTDKQYDQQLLKNTHQRGQLQLEKSNRLFEMQRAHDDYNLQAANQRKMKQKLEKERQIQEQRRQLELLNQRKIKRHVPGQTK